MRLLVVLLIIFVAQVTYAGNIAALLDSARYYKFSNPAKTLAFAQEAYSQAKDEHNINQQGDGAFLSGLACYLTGNYEKALGYYLDAEHLYESAKNNSGIIDVYTDLCIFYLKQKKIALATTTIDKAIHLADSINDNQKKGNSYNNKGLIYLDTKRYDSAIICFNKSYASYKVPNDKIGMAYSLGYLASAYSESNMPDKSLECLQQSIPLLVEAGDKFGAASGINNIGELLLQQHKPEQALPYFKDACEKSKLISFRDLEDNTYRMMAACYREMGDYKKAYEATQAQIAVHEKLQNDHQIKAIEELQTKYETGKKEQQNKLLTETNLRQSLQLSRTRIINYALLAIALLIIAMLYLFYNRYKLRQEARFREEFISHEKLRAHAIVDAEENERQRLARELHDGIGQLLAATRRKIQNMEHAEVQAEAAYEETIGLLDESIKEVRQLSHNMMPPSLRNKTLVQAISELARQVVQTTSLKVHTDWIDTENLELDKIQVLMLYRSLQEIISNVIRHAAATNLNIEIANHDNELNIVVYDNGSGFDKEAVIKSGAGIGLKNIQSRIEYIGGQLQIDTHPGKGTTYIIYLPLNKEV